MRASNVPRRRRKRRDDGLRSRSAYTNSASMSEEEKRRSMAIDMPCVRGRAIGLHLWHQRAAATCLPFHRALCNYASFVRFTHRPLMLLSYRRALLLLQHGGQTTVFRRSPPLAVTWWPPPLAPVRAAQLADSRRTAARFRDTPRAILAQARASRHRALPPSTRRPRARAYVANFFLSPRDPSPSLAAFDSK